MSLKHLLLALAGLASAAPAWGQTANYDFERLRLDPAATDSLVLGGGAILPVHAYRLGLALGYERQPIALADDGHLRGVGIAAWHDRGSDVVSDRVTAHLTGAISLTRAIELGLELPIVAYQTGASGLDNAGVAAPWVGLRFGSDPAQSFAGAVSLYVSPRWTGSVDFGGNTDWTAMPGVGGTWRFGNHAIVANGSFVLRPAAVDLGAQKTFNEARVGLGWSMTSGALRYEVTARAAFETSGLGESAELLGGVRYRMGPLDLFGIAGPGFMDLPGSPTFRALIGLAYGGALPVCSSCTACGAVAAPVAAPPVVAAPPPKPVDPCAPGQAHTPEQCPALDDDGDGIPNGQDLCPTVKGIPEEKGCPAKDTDGDGIPDHLDKCPTVKGTAEFQGCPPPDRDGDGIPDAEDKCPDQPGVPELQGCPPQRAKINVETGKIDITEKVFFDTGKATIQARSNKLLDDVASLLVANKGIANVLVEGHTDNTGAADFNRTLSQERADAVKAYLVSKGVDAGRLEAKGFGPDQPAQPNTTAAGRDANRRVEFSIKGVAAK